MCSFDSQKNTPAGASFVDVLRCGTNCFQVFQLTDHMPYIPTCAAILHLKCAVYFHVYMTHGCVISTGYGTGLRNP